MSIDGPGREELRTVAARLHDAGLRGRGFRRELLKQLNDAVKPLAREIADVEHLKQYMPDRYAEVLAADLAVRAQRILAGNARVSISARTRRDRRRRVNLLDDGLINHPIYPRGPRKRWNWVNGQTGGMRPGFFTDPCENAGPDVRAAVLDALVETAKKITAP